MALEARLRDYLARDIGRIDPGLSLLAVEHPVPAGRVDLLARDAHGIVGVELKARPYGTDDVCEQLCHYLRVLPRVYFVAPKVKRGVYDGLRDAYGEGRLRLYEVSPSLACARMTPEQLVDARPFPRIAVPREIPSPLSGTARSLLHALAVQGAERLVQDPLARKLLKTYVDHVLRPQRS